MEGPSLVIACEEFAPFLGRKVSKAVGTAKLPFQRIKGHPLSEVQSWGKHFLIRFESLQLRIHFLMFGSYRINNARENRIPKLELSFGKDRIYFYSCAISVLEDPPKNIYDWSIDIMSPEWNPKKALAKVKAKPEAMVCDLLMDQEIFAGVGNIIKNEVLYNLALHPEVKVRDLTPKQLGSLVKEARSYSLQFYEWKKINQLKRHWHIFRKKTCPECGGPVTKKPTGKGQRLSHFCKKRQKLPKSVGKMASAE
jgi:endonuclease-8